MGRYLRYAIFAVLTPILILLSICVWRSIFYWDGSTATGQIDCGYTNGRVAVITGASPGSVGFEASVALALVGVDVDVISRSQQRGAETVAALQREVEARRSNEEKNDASVAECRTGTFNFHVADLQRSPVHQVRAAAASIKKKRSRTGRIDMLLLNAGIFSLSPYSVSTEEIVMKDAKHNLTVEGQTAVSYISHYVLTAALLPLLMKSNSPRIVATETLGIFLGNLNNFSFAPPRESYTESNVTRIQVHCNVKLALMSMLEQVALSYRKSVRVVHSHPGMTKSNLLRDFPDIREDAFHRFWGMQPTRVGALSLVRAAVDHTIEKLHGEFVAPNWAVRGFPVLGHILPIRESHLLAENSEHRTLFDRTAEVTGTVWP